MSDDSADDGLNMSHRNAEYIEKVQGSGFVPDSDTAEDGAVEMPDTGALFQPLQIGPLELPNRIVMAPMTRNFSPGGVPGPDVAEYYRLRAAGGVGLIVTEGALVPHPGAGFSSRVPRFHGEDALAGWRRVVEAVHAEGVRIFPQLWHVGMIPLPGDDIDAPVTSPSGLCKPDLRLGEPADEGTIVAAIEAFGAAAASAMAIGCDGLQIHGAHGYLIDQFFWSGTNLRDDAWGGPSMEERSRFAVEVIRACRRATSPDFPIMFRFSQWKQQDFTARMAETPTELERFLAPLVDAGVDIFDCSTRRFWEPEFAGSDLNLAGWTRHITGKPTATVGSVSLNIDLFSSFVTTPRLSNNMGALIRMLERGDFDLVDVGRSLIANPDWAAKVRSGDFGALASYDAGMLAALA